MQSDQVLKRKRLESLGVNKARFYKPDALHVTQQYRKALNLK